MYDLSEKNAFFTPEDHNFYPRRKLTEVVSTCVLTSFGALLSVFSSYDVQEPSKLEGGGVETPPTPAPSVN